MTEGMSVLESASASLTIHLCHHPAVYGGLGHLLPDLDLCAWKALDGLILQVVVVVVFALERARRRLLRRRWLAPATPAPLLRRHPAWSSLVFVCRVAARSVFDFGG